MKTKLKLIKGVALLVLLSTLNPQLSTALAQGTAFTYQGRLNDGTNPAGGTYDLRFSIYDLAANGTLLAGPVTNSTTGVSNGLFTVTLDFGVNVFTGADRWLDIAVRTNGGGAFIVLSPRQKLTPTPYAIFANTAGNVSGTIPNGALPSNPSFSGTVTATAFSGNGTNLTSLNAGNITGGTLADARLSANVALRAGGNTFTEPQIFNGPIYLNTTNGFDQSSVGAFLIDAAFLPGGRFAVLENGNVGIGNPSPAYRLDVGGDVGLPLPATIYAAGNPILRVDVSGNSFVGNFAGNVALSGVANVGIGYGSLYFDTLGSYNTAVGYGSLNLNANGNYNTAIGAFALVSNTSGYDNTASGYQALYFNTSGTGNTVSGYQSFYSNTTGNNNVAYGLQALYANTNGYANTANGYQALYSNTSGHDNAASGFNALYANTSGSENVADGEFALFGNTTGNQNTATGVGALYYNSIGGNDVANGYQALYANTIGINNTANGSQALYSNTNGSWNTANGYQALYANTAGGDNTANGAWALYANKSGDDNTADGDQALYSNTTGSDNTAVGHAALENNTGGGFNTANGDSALSFNTNGSYNVAIGTGALGFNGSGSYDTAVGENALEFNSTGNRNIALGQQAGLNITRGDDNIDIGNLGVTGDRDTIRIGIQGTQTNTFIAGISGAPVTGSAVVVNSSGQLGVAPSSQRFKQNIQTMGDVSDVLLALRPVTFQYKPEIDPQGLAQFGLIAEQVEKVDPNLVVHDRAHGIYTVRYEAVNAMLLNEFLKQHRTVKAQNSEIQDLKQQNEALKKRLDNLEQMVKSLIAKD